MCQKAAGHTPKKLPEIYERRYGENFFDTLPEIVWNRSESIAGRTPRYQYLRLISELFDEGFLKTIYRWCSEHHLKYAGHLMCEHSLLKQGEYCGEAMRHYHHFHIPGVDMLNDARKYTTVKQAVSVARQDGRQFNSFGAFHQRRRTPCAPASWYPDDDNFLAGYALAPMGLLMPPKLLTQNFLPTIELNHKTRLHSLKSTCL